jgi:hypothetical protein
MPPLAAASPGAHLSAADRLPAADRFFLVGLQRQFVRYFLDNQHPCGLVLDRQRNHGPRLPHGLCSTTATGMGFIALALASAPPYRLTSPFEARIRVGSALEALRDRLPNDRGVLPHFVHSVTGAIHGYDHCSTIETAWAVTGGLWAARFLKDSALEALARDLYGRVDWHYWTAPAGSATEGLLWHGKDAQGRFLQWCWDRLNGETAFMYVLAAGAETGRAVVPESWSRLRTYPGSVAGLRFNNADLGLFVFQYGLDLLDLFRWQAPGKTDLWAEAAVATDANQRACEEAASSFTTYQHYWGLSAGDGPDEVYRAYSPAGPIDGTAHLTAALASVAHLPSAVLDNLRRAEQDSTLRPRGRYGFSSINVDCGWVSRDMIGIDAGAAVLALDNFLHDGRVRSVFHSLPCVQQGLERLHFTPREPFPPQGVQSPPPARRAS